MLQHWQNKITRTNLGKNGLSLHRNEWPSWILGLCLSREVIVLLLLSCCDGINDQDKTIILLPLSYTSHHPKKEKSLLLLKARNNIQLYHFNLLEKTKLRMTQEEMRNMDCLRYFMGIRGCEQFSFITWI